MLHKWMGLMFVTILTLSCGDDKQLASFENLESVEGLVAHSKEFEQRVVQVTEGVHVAIGYGLANSIMVEGESGVIIIDTMETVENAEAVLAEFRKITSKPVEAIIYTHNHADHIFGARVFAEGRDIPVYAHDTTAHYIDRLISIVRPIMSKRSMRMFGNYLDESLVINDGIGPKLGITEESRIGLLRPTQTFSGELEAESAGISFKLIAAPGETNDQLFVYIEDKGVLMPGDNIYKTFPNLYTIRGTPYRDVKAWVASLDKMRYLHADHLVPSHTGPISGKQEVFDTLTAYRDGIQYVHDRTIYGMNRGLTPDELVEVVKLPPHLANHPFLQEYYGTVAWSVRSVFDGNLGWFDGNPTHLFPLPPTEAARGYMDLAGGETALADKIGAALKDEDYQWVLELSDHLLRVNPEHEEVRAARVEALTKLGEGQANPNARHYYLTQAAELGQDLKIRETSARDKSMMAALSLRGFFDSLAVNLNAEKAADVDQKVAFVFPDIDETYTMHVRRGIVEVQPFLLEDPDLTATVDSSIWKEMLGQMRGPAMTIARHIEVEGGKLAFTKFMTLFDALPEE